MASSVVMRVTSCYICLAESMIDVAEAVPICERCAEFHLEREPAKQEQPKRKATYGIGDLPSRYKDVKASFNGITFKVNPDTKQWTYDPSESEWGPDVEP